MALRNLEEQVLYLTNELIKIKQSLGTALPDPIEGPEGPEGPEGQRGVSGEQGFGIVGFGTQLPSSGRNGDWFILKTSTMTGIDYVMYRCVSQHWVAQFSMRGPAGPIANATEVVANPETSPSETLYKLKVDGVTYLVNDADLISYIQEIEPVIYIENGYIEVDESVNFNHTTHFLDNAYFDELTYFDNGIQINTNSLEDIRDSNGDALIICERLTDENGNARFVEGNLTTETITGVTFTYAKWSLSGSHLMIVLAGNVANGSTINYSQWFNLNNLPNYIKSKITPTFSDVVTIKTTSVYKSDWTYKEIGFVLYKTASTIECYQYTNESFDYDGQFRIQIDLLIDMA